MEKPITAFKKWMILFNVTLSVFMATLDGSIVNIALPVISGQLNVNISSVQWIVTAYLLAISVLLLIWGKLSDAYGKKKVFAFGFAVFTLGSALCGLSTNLHMLVISRIVQAIGASATMALSQGIITEVFAPNERGKALGINGTTVAVGALVGPSLGGFLVHLFGWQSIFFINIPIGIAGVMLTFLIMPELHREDGDKAFDYKGSVLFIVSILLLFTSLLFFQDGVLSPALFALLFVASLAILAGFIYYEKTAQNPLLNLKLFKIPIFSLGISSAFLSFVAINTILLFIPFYLQLGLRTDALSAGLLMSAYPITLAILAPVSGALSDKISYSPLTVSGLCLNTLVFFWLTTLTASSGRFKITLLLVLMGAGMAFFQSPNTSSIMNAVPKNSLGVAGAVSALFRNLGLVTGTTVSVMIFSFSTKMNINRMADGDASSVTLFLKGFRYVLIFAGLSCLAGAALSLKRAVGSRPDQNDPPIRTGV